MARNRRKSPGSLRLAPVMRALVLCIFLGGSGVGYVLQKNKIYELGRQMKVREVQLEKLKWENKIRSSQLAELQLPQKLAERVRTARLGLVMPQPAQIVWLAEPALRPSSNVAPGFLVLGERERTFSH